MRKIINLLTLTLGISSISIADTIDYWHVSYNSLKMKEFNKYSKREIVLKVKDIKKDDTISVAYFDDTPSMDCLTKLTIENEYNISITNILGRGTSIPLHISILDLLENTKSKFYKIYYSEVNGQQKVLLFKLVFE